MAKGIIGAVAIIIFLVIGLFVTNHDEVICNNNLTMKKFLAERSIVMSGNSPKASMVYPIVLVSDRPLRKINDQDALWTIDEGNLHFLFTSDPNASIELCKK